MGFQYFRRPVTGAAQTVTSTGVLNSFGVSVIQITGAGAKTFTLPIPGSVQTGPKTILVNSTGVMKVSVVIGGSTLSGFIMGAGGNAAGSTFRTIVFSSLSTKRRFVQLVPVSASQWALAAASTGLAASNPFTG